MGDIDSCPQESPVASADGLIYHVSDCQRSAAHPETGGLGVGRLHAGSGLLVIALMLAGRAAAAHPLSHGTKKATSPPSSVKAAPGGTVVDPAGLRCLTQLRRMHV